MRHFLALFTAVALERGFFTVLLVQLHYILDEVCARALLRQVIERAMRLGLWRVLVSGPRARARCPGVVDRVVLFWPYLL